MNWNNKKLKIINQKIKSEKILKYSFQIFKNYLTTMLKKSLIKIICLYHFLFFKISWVVKIKEKYSKTD